MLITIGFLNKEKMMLKIIPLFGGFQKQCIIKILAP